MSANYLRDLPRIAYTRDRSNLSGVGAGEPPQGRASQNRLEVVDKHAADKAPTTLDRGGAVRRENHVGQVTDRVVRRQRLIGKDVNGRGDPANAKLGHEIAPVDEMRPAQKKQKCVVPEQSEA